MPIRQATAPTPYLFTDERVEQVALLRAVRRLPRGGVVVFRHYRTPEDARVALYRRLRTITRRRGVRILDAGPNRSRFADNDGWHFSNWRGGMLRRSPPITASAHNWTDLILAKRAGARTVFISPVFATNSHKGARALGPIAYQQMARRAKILGMIPIPLGGMNAPRARMLKAQGFGAIDALAR